MKPHFLFVVSLFVSLSVEVFYVPGVQPHDFKNGERVVLNVERLSSAVTQLPFSYYALPFCPPGDNATETENLGEILRGDRIQHSPFAIEALVEVNCALLCQIDYTPDQLALFHERIGQKYRAHWIVDNLPAMTLDVDFMSRAKALAIPKYLDEGFPIGERSEELPEYSSTIPPTRFLHNHFDLTFYYNEQNPSSVRIVGFAVDPDSVEHSTTLKNGVPTSCDSRSSQRRQSVSLSANTRVSFTYSVKWTPSELKWHNRWEPIFSVQSGKVHWFSILNSIIIVLFLTSMVAVIMTNILKSDFKRYSEMSTLASTTASLLTDDVETGDTKGGKAASAAAAAAAAKEEREETGWKLVYADVFRPPAFSMIFAVLNGFGMQVTACTVITMVFSVLGFLSPANRGSLLTAMIISFALTGGISGFFSGRLYKLFGGQHWRSNALMTASFVQGSVALIFLILDILIASQKSSGHIPPNIMFLLIVIWVGIATPLVFIGSYIAYFRSPTIEVPTRTNLIPRDIPPQPWYNNTAVCVLLGGVLPFSAIFIELFFILGSIWLDQIYYLFGFLLLVFLVLLVACSEVSIVLTYIQLCGEDWRWWWRSFLSVGASALYLFLYSVFYFFTNPKLQITQTISIVIYFGYTLIMTVIFFTFTGSVGFYASFWFVKKIYSSIKVD